MRYLYMAICVALIVAKIVGIIRTSWWSVTLPIWGAICIFVLFFLLADWASKDFDE